MLGALPGKAPDTQHARLMVRIGRSPHPQPFFSGITILLYLNLIFPCLPLQSSYIILILILPSSYYVCPTMYHPLSSSLATVIIFFRCSVLLTFPFLSSRYVKVCVCVQLSCTGEVMCTTLPGKLTGEVL